MLAHNVYTAKIASAGESARQSTHGERALLRMHNKQVLHHQFREKFFFFLSGCWMTESYFRIYLEAPSFLSRPN